MSARDILFVTTYSGLGGGETSLLTLVEHLDPARYRPHLLVPAQGQLSERWGANGWPTHVTSWRGASVYFVPALWMRFPAVGRIEALIRKQNIRLVHSDYHSLPFALAAARRTGIPCVWTCWGWWFHPRVW
ncbi:MAG: glycosyltransferase, partial [Anaerolineae bacterium]|nr:glycosyltransferase [Anaerolineae bacterium]